MVSRVQVGERILEEEGYWKDGWESNIPVEGVKLGCFAWKRQRHILIRMLPIFEKYSYQPVTEMLGEFLTNQDDPPFTFKEDSFENSLNAKTRESKQTWTGGGVISALMRGDVQHSNEEKINIPALDLKIIKINRSDLEKTLKSRKLDMKSPYIAGIKRNKGIPCIISGIVEAAIAENEADIMPTAVKKRRTEGNVLGTNIPKIGYVGETCETTEGFRKGPVLYKVLPLEIDPDGNIEAREDSKGFLQDKIVSDSCHNFSASTNPTIKSSFTEIERVLQPIVDDKTVAEAFRSLSNEDLQYLCRLFEKVQDCRKDIEEPDTMSPICREILLYAKFQPQEPKTLVLKEVFHDNESFTGCYYLAAVLAEFPTSIRQLFAETTVSLFPLIKSILIDAYDKTIVVDTISKCNAANVILEMFDIPTPNQLAKVVWIAMLYGGREEK